MVVVTMNCCTVQSSPKTTKYSPLVFHKENNNNMQIWNIGLNKQWQFLDKLFLNKQFIFNTLYILQVDVLIASSH